MKETVPSDHSALTNYVQVHEPHGLDEDSLHDEELGVDGEDLLQ